MSLIQSLIGSQRHCHADTLYPALLQSPLSERPARCEARAVTGRRCPHSTKIFSPSPVKRPNLAQNWHFWQNIGIFGPFDPMLDKKTMRTSCLGGFSVMCVPKLSLTPVKIRIFGQKLTFLPNIGIFGPFGLMADQKTMRTRCLGVFPLCGYQNFCFLPRNFGPKMAKFGPQYGFAAILGKILAFLAHLVPCPTKKQCEQGA